MHACMHACMGNIASYISYLAQYTNYIMYIYIQRIPGNQAGFNQFCASRGEGGGAGVLKGLGIYSLLLLSLIAAVIF